MFCVKLRPLYHVCDKVIFRNLRTRRSDVGLNPGLNKRVAAFKEEGFKIVDEDAEEFIEQSESNFYNVGEVYNEHINETLIGKFDKRHQIIKEKYFKENMPNLLTWSEKEQIRHLAATQPDEWTPEKIAESFPVTVPVLKKLLKYPWKPATEQRIARHDASVMRNWKELKEGSLDIPEQLRQQFLKFSDRVIPPLNKKSIKIDLTSEEKIDKMGEFERIIQRCAAKENSNSKDHKNYNQTDGDQDGENSRDPSIKKDYKRVTFDELTTRIKKQLEQGDNVDMPDKLILDTVKSSISKSIESNHEDLYKEIELYDNKTCENQVSVYKEKEESTAYVMDYPERIRIPKKVYKKGATYKVNDCYYDHDGRFLYRVLGMS